jgi:hypothetical protein
VDATYTLALDQLRQAEPAAVQLVEVCALLAPDEIPVGWLLDTPDLLPSPLAEAASDPLRRREIAGALYQAALLTPDMDDTARLHRLVQAVILHHLPDRERSDRVATAVELLAALFPSESWELETWPTCARLLPHALALVDHADHQPASSALGELLHRTGTYVWARRVTIPASPRPSATSPRTSAGWARACAPASSTSRPRPCSDDYRSGNRPLLRTSSP